jgi:hypothetical protein
MLSNKGRQLVQSATGQALVWPCSTERQNEAQKQKSIICFLKQWKFLFTDLRYANCCYYERILFDA